MNKRLVEQRFPAVEAGAERHPPRRAPSPQLAGAGCGARLKCLSAAVVLALGLSACGGGSSDPVLPNACAVVDGTLQGRLSGAGFSSYRIVSGPAKGQLDLTNPLTGEFIYTPNPGLRGTAPFLEDRFQFQAHHSDGSSNVATFRLVYTARVMSLGDSITWGGPGSTSSCPDHAGYRKPLYDVLRSAGYAVNFVGTLRSGASAGLADPDHEGHGAWSADELLSGRSSSSCTGGGNLGVWLDDTQPDVVLLHTGTNDLNGGGAGSGDPVQEAQDVGDILARINRWELDRWPVYVLVARIIVNHARGEAATRLFNDTVLREFVQPAVQAGDQVLSVDHESALNDFARHYIDELHPSAAGYQRMADVWFDALGGVLPKCP